MLCCCAMKAGSSGAGAAKFSCAVLFQFLLLCFMASVSLVAVCASGAVMCVAVMGVIDQCETAGDLDAWFDIFDAIGEPTAPILRTCPAIIGVFRAIFQALLCFLVLAQEILPLLPGMGCCRRCWQGIILPGNLSAGMFYVFVGVTASCIDISHVSADLEQSVGRDAAQAVQTGATVGPFLIVLCGIYNMTLGKILGGPRAKVKSYRKSIGL
jgi:hypothetical protein